MPAFAPGEYRVVRLSAQTATTLSGQYIGRPHLPPDESRDGADRRCRSIPIHRRTSGKVLSALRRRAGAVQRPGPVDCRYRDRETLRRLPIPPRRSEEHTSELQSLMRISYAVFCLKKKNKHTCQTTCKQTT